MKRWMSAFLLLLVMLALSITVVAEGGQVTYSGNAGSFIFTPGSEFSPTDLFPNFKDVMPGDVLRQQITIRNDADRQVKIKVYLRALGAHEDSVAFLSQIGLLVEQEGDSVLFAASADQTAQLTDWVCLGTVYSGGEINLNVLLEVPVTLDNSYKKMIGYLDWEFMIEEFPVEESDPKPPAQTGDESNLYLHVGAMAGSGILLLILLLMGHRKKERDDTQD